MTRQPEPCEACGEDTAAGTPLFSDRLDVDRGDGSLVYLCSFCAGQVRAGGHEVHEMTDEQREKLERAAFAFGAFAPGGH